MTIKAVVFDVGNVLIGWNPEEFFDGVIGKDRREAFFAECDMSDMNERVDLGHHFTDTIEAHVEANPSWEAEIRIWHDRWIDMVQPEITHSVRLMKALQAREVPVFSLTNFGVQTYELASKHYGFLKEFDRDFISGHLKVIKPDPKIYQLLEEGSGMSGADLLFTDDRPDNIEAAKARGWNAHLFEGPEGWAERLVAEGLLSAEEAK